MADPITAENFKKYGWVIEYPGKKARPANNNLFRVVKRESMPVGWRIAYLVTRDKVIRRLEQHQDTFESFEPVKGRSVFFVSDKKDLSSIRCFDLNKPVILKKAIWHGIVAKGTETEVKITENAVVRSVYWKLKGRLDARGKILQSK